MNEISKKILIIFLYFLTINIFAFIQVYMDKNKSIKGQYRISENRLILTAIIGGSIGTLISMNKFRHKTKKLKFKLGIPIIMIFQILIIIIILLAR